LCVLVCLAQVIIDNITDSTHLLWPVNQIITPAIQGKTMKKLQAFTGLYIIFAVVALLAGCTGTQTKIGADESFSIAWAESSGSISLRNSKDGLTWTSVDFPQSILSTTGPGIAADTLDIVHFLATGDKTGHTVGQFGLGPTAYTIATPEILDKSTALAMQSAPALAPAGTNKWYVAFRQNNSVKLLLLTRTVKVGTNQFDYKWTDTTPVLSVNNTLVQGKPSIAVIGDKVLLSWYRGSTPAELQMVVGTITTSGTVTWKGGYVFPYTHSSAGAVELAHDLTQDGSQFVLGVVREDLPASPPLKLYSLHTYGSKDGQQWQALSVLGSKSSAKSVHQSNPLGLAVKSNGHMFVAQSAAGQLRAFFFNGSKWNDVSGSFSGVYPLKGTGIAVVNTGRP
jgi:hypothetical protein